LIAVPDETENVGFKRPPKHSRFRPGQSGNPSGRPVGVRTLKSDLVDELRQETTVQEHGRKQSVSKQRAFIKTLVAGAINGDMRAINVLLSFCATSLGGQSDDMHGGPPDVDDVDIVKNFASRERRRRRIDKEEINPHQEQEEKKV
jgi:hypothetical protein